jgi:hypothetical protein
MVTGRDLKADAVRSGVHLYRLAGEASINPARLSRILNDHAEVDPATEARIREAIERLAPAEPVR